MDPGTGLTILGSAFGSAKVLEKLLGPSAELIGQEIKQWIKKRIENVQAIISKAEKRLGDQIENDGQVPPKILYSVLNEGSFASDQLTQEYFAGLLAASRTIDSLDDRANSLFKLVAQLSSYQLRAHYIIYHLIRKINTNSNYSFTKSTERPLMRIFIPMAQFIQSVGISDDQDKISIIPHILFGLRRLDLIEDFVYSSAELEYNDSGAQEAGLRVIPCEYGAQLFLWSYGKRNIPSKELLNENLDLPLIQEIELPENVIHYPEKK